MRCKDKHICWNLPCISHSTELHAQVHRHWWYVGCRRDWSLVLSLLLFFFLPELDLSSTTLLRWTRWMRPLSTCQLVGRCCSAIPGTPRLWRKSISSCLFSDSLSPALCVVRARLFCFITACLHDHFCLITACSQSSTDHDTPPFSPQIPDLQWQLEPGHLDRQQYIQPCVYRCMGGLNSNGLPAHSDKAVAWDKLPS